MIITDKFVFIHIPKTGGSFVREILLNYFQNINPDSTKFHHAPAFEYSGNLPLIYVKRDFETWKNSFIKYWSNRAWESTNPYLACMWSDGDIFKYYNEMYEYMLVSASEKIEIDFNNLRNNLCTVLENLNAITPEQIEVVMNHPKINVTQYEK